MKTEPKTTRQLIKEAFIHLMTKKPYLEITVSDVVKEAGVARASFYRNFSSVNDVLNDILDKIISGISESILTVVSGNDERKWREFLFSLFYRLSREDFSMLAQCFENAGILLSRINAGIYEMSQRMPSNTLDEKYTPYGRMGFIVNVMKRWADCGMEDSPEEMVNYIMMSIMPKA